MLVPNYSKIIMKQSSFANIYLLGNNNLCLPTLQLCGYFVNNRAAVVEKLK